MAATLAQLRDAAKDLCDHQNNPSVPDATWNRWINDGINRLWRVVTKRDAGQFQTAYFFTITAAGNVSPLPTNCRRVIGVSRDPLIAGSRRSLRKYNFGERDNLGFWGARSYRVIGNAISIEPAVNSIGNYGLYYVTGPTVLSADSSTIDAGLDQFGDYPTTWAAIKALEKEESDASSLRNELAFLEQSIDETVAMSDGDDPSTIVDDDARGPAWFFSLGYSGSATGFGLYTTVDDIPALIAFVVTGLVSGQAVIRVASVNRLYFLQDQTSPATADDSATSANVVWAPDGRIWVGA